MKIIKSDRDKNAPLNTFSIILIALIVFILLGATYFLINEGSKPVEVTTTTLPEGSALKGKSPVAGDNHLHAIATNFLAGSFLVGTHHGLYVTRDGNNWKRHELLGDTDLMSIFVSPSNPDNAYLAGHSIGVLKTMDGVTTLEEINKGLPHLDVHAVAADPGNFDHVFAFVVGFGLFESQEGGQEWRLLNDSIDGVSGLAKSPSLPRTIYAATFNNGFMVSSDDGRTFIPSNEGLGTTDVTSVAINPKNNLEIVIGIFGAGIYLSTDGGKKWEASNKGLGDMEIAALYQEATVDGNLYVGASNGTIYVSSDFGRSWQKI